MLKIVTVIVIVVLFIALAAIAGNAKRKAKKSDTKNDYNYTSKAPLSENEQAIYWKLIDALPGYVVLAQVVLTSCIKTKGMPAFNTINGKSLDFVICNKALEIVAAIEIDDQSHSTPAAQKRDITKNKAMETAGIKLIRWPATPLPSKEQIQIEFPSIKQPPVENVQDKKIKILERQLFDMAARLKNTAVTKA